MPSLVSTGSITIADVNDGSSVYTASIYIQQITQPATPSGGSYNFSSKVLTPPSGWASSLPTASTTPTWVAVYTFSTITPSVAVTATSWGTPALFVQNGVNGNNGTNGLTAILSNESHVFPASSSGVVSSYVNSGTDIRVYEGGTELIYDGIGTSNGTWKITSASSNLTVGTLTDQGAYLTIGAHSGVADATDLSSATYTITGKNSAGISFTLVKVQSFTKSKSGANGSPGAQGPTVRMTYDRPPTFSSTDGVLDANQASITFSLLLSGITASSYSWTFVKPDNTLVTLAGVTTNSATCTISQANFIDGDASRKSLKVVCVVNGVANYTDSITIIRLEKSTAAAGATVGASWGSNISNQPSDSQIFNNMQHDSWIAGQTPPWSLNGASACSAIVYDTNVNGVQEAVWKCTSDTSLGANGGWHSSAFNVDKTKPYRFAVTVKITSGSTGNWYWGVMENSVCDLNTPYKNANPYFRYGGRSGLVLNRWYLIVGYVFPAGSTGNTNAGSGIWDMTTGDFVSGGTNFCWASDTTYSYSRAYQFYCANAGETQVFGYPVVEVVDGTESKIFNNLGYSALLNTQQKWSDVSTDKYDDAKISNVIEENGTLFVSRPIGASYNLNQGAVTGVIKIILPQGFTNTMMKFSVAVYTYSQDKSFTLNIAGYNFETGIWYNTESNLIGSTAADNRVRFGYDSALGKCCIYIGETTSSWSYPKVVIRNFVAGYSHYARGLWESGWSIDINTNAPQNVSVDYADSLIDAASIRNQGALATQSAVTWNSQVTGTGKPADYADVTNYADTRVANSLLLSNSSFNLITDNSLSNPSWWGFGSNTLPSGWTANTATQTDQPQRFFIKSSGGGDFDYWGTHFQVANNTQYRVKLSMFISNDFTGLIAPLVYFPGVTWALPGSPVNDPNSAFPYGHTAASWGAGAWNTLETITTTSSRADLNWLQTRICGRVTTGYCGFFIEVTSLFGGAGQITSSNASTFIANAAIGSAQITDAAITNAKIDRASVNRLQVVTADIVDANVSTLKIGQDAVTVTSYTVFADNVYTDTSNSNVWHTIGTSDIPLNAQTYPSMIDIDCIYTASGGQLLTGYSTFYNIRITDGSDNELGKKTLKNYQRFRFYIQNTPSVIKIQTQVYYAYNGSSWLYSAVGSTYTFASSASISTVKR